MLPLMLAAIDDGGAQSGLFAALLIGIAFGIALERSGLGSARKLAGQFTLTDLTVFKVMFTAIVTAMLGSFWLDWLGVIDLATVFVPGTWLVPQLAGGLLFGAGFAVAGLCPGTSCVAAASGRVDGAATVAGMLGGVLLTGLALAHFAGFYDSTSRGALTLPELLGMPRGAVIAIVTAVALAGFKGAEWVERRARS